MKQGRVISRLPQVLWKKISFFKKFPGVEKVVILRKWIDEATMEQWKEVKFIGDFIGARLIDVINRCYEESYQEHIKKNTKYIQKQLKQQHLSDKQREGRKLKNSKK